MMIFKNIKQGLVIVGLLILTACGGNVFEKGDSAPSSPPDVSGIPDAVPKHERFRPQNQKSYVVLGKRYYPMSSNIGYQEKGVASWYGKKFHGRQTATGEAYDMYQMTAAHKTLPLPSYAEVTNLSNGRKIIVRVNDRGPFHGGRIIDLSYTAATKLGIIGRGTGQVEVRAINATDYMTAANSQKQVAPVAVKTMAGNQANYVGSGLGAQKKPASGVYLQVGTFSSIGRAEEFKDKLARQLDESVFLMPIYRPQGALYRVRVGPLTNVEASEAMAVKLKSFGVSDSHAVIE